MLQYLFQKSKSIKYFFALSIKNAVLHFTSYPSIYFISLEYVRERYAYNMNKREDIF